MKTIMLSLLFALIGCGQKTNKLSAKVNNQFPKLEATSAQGTFHDQLKIYLNDNELKTMDRNESIHFISRIMFQKSQRGLKSDKKLVRKLIHYPRIFNYNAIDLEKIDPQVYQYKLNLKALNRLEVLDGLQYGLLSIDHQLKSFHHKSTFNIYRNDYQQNDLIYNHEVDNSEIKNLTVSSSSDFNSNFLISYIKKFNINGLSFEEEIKSKSEELLITISTPDSSKNIYLKDKFKNLKELITSLDKRALFDDYGNIRKFLGKENQLDNYQRRDAVSQDNYTWQFFTDKPLDINSTINPGDHIFIIYDQIKNFETVELLKFKTTKEPIVISSSPYKINFKTEHSKFQARFNIDKVIEPNVINQTRIGHIDTCYHRLCKTIKDRSCKYHRQIIHGTKKSSTPNKHLDQFIFNQDSAVIPTSKFNKVFVERNLPNSCTREAEIKEERVNKSYINTIYGKLEAELILNF